MKTKKIKRKLSLSKATIANLTNADMLKQHGGASGDETHCKTECVTPCLPCDPETETRP